MMTPAQKKAVAEREAIASRLVTFRKKYIQIDQQDLADEIGINVRTLSFYETGRNIPNQKTVTYLSNKYNLNAEWLMTGKGEPISIAKATPDSIANMQARLATLEAQVKSLIDVVEELTSKGVDADNIASG